MKVGGKQGLTRKQFHVLIENLKCIADELKAAKQEEEGEEGDENEEKKD